MPARKRRRLLASSQATPTQSIPEEPLDPLEAGVLTAQTGLSLATRLDAPPLTVGRHPSSSLIIDEATVSSRHCSVSAFLSSADHVLCVLSDCSLNGTQCNGESLRKTSRILQNGDRLVVGGIQLVFSTKRGQPALPTSRDPQQQHGDYVILPQDLGKGSFAKVSLGVNLKTKAQIACKIIEKVSQHSAYRQRIQREVEVMLHLDHPGLIKLHDVFETEQRLILMLQLVTGGDLFQLLEKRRLNGSEAKFVTYSLLQALRYLHDDKGISHRDLKVENILVEDSTSPYPRVFISDLGTARFDQGVATTQCGTFSYLAPELLIRPHHDAAYDGRKLDCWSMGVIIYFMLGGFHPFDRFGGDIDFPDSDEEEESPERQLIIDQVLKGEPAWPSDPWSLLDPDARTLITSFLTVDPRQRATAAQGLASAWIIKSKKALKKSYAVRVERSVTK